MFGNKVFVKQNLELRGVIEVTKLGALSLKNGASSGCGKEITVAANVSVLRTAGKCSYSLGVGRG